ncbi:MAG: hypothetical protein E7604_12600 [Ruminococcaceae bacterium]|nr:hypothetical protein [Oscillospiraceae bacterium]
MTDRIPDAVGSPKMYLDFHTHILPEMDDGSASAEMSVQMLRTSVEQGVRAIVLTPHFYAHQDTLEHFMEKRRRALAELRRRWTVPTPILLPGAEVYYFREMADIPELLTLRIRNTELFLLEMPFRKWTDAMIDDILRMNQKNGVRVVLAHVDRYIAYQPKGTVEMLADSGVLMQVNADYFYEKSTRQKALRMFDSGLMHFLGSDCHNVTSRPQKLGDGIAVIRERFGDEQTDAFFRGGLRRLLAAQADRYGGQI